MARTLLTGATGFLGGYVATEMAGRGAETVAMAREASDRTLLEGLHIPTVSADLSDPPSLARATEGVDSVIHLAAYYTFHGKAELYERITVQGTRNLLEACLKNGVKRFIYCSSTEAIGPVEKTPGDETTPLNPQYEYGRSKLRAEAVIKEYAGRGIDYTILRPTGLYGPRNIDDVAYSFIASFAKNSISTRFIVGSGHSLIQFTHVRDAARAFALALENPKAAYNQTYIITDGHCYRYSEVYRILAEICGRRPPGTHVPPYLAKAMIAPIEAINRIRGKEDFMWHVSTVDSVTRDRCYSGEKALRELGFKPRVDLMEGLAETLDWYRKEGHV